MNDPIATLMARLDVGWLLIDQEPDSARTAELEDHWIRLLAQYVAAVDAQRSDPPVPITTAWRAA